MKQKVSEGSAIAGKSRGVPKSSGSLEDDIARIERRIEKCISRGEYYLLNPQKGTNPENLKKIEEYFKKKYYTWGYFPARNTKEIMAQAYTELSWS